MSDAKPIDFSKMEFEERTVSPGWREIRILAPEHPDATEARPDTLLTGNDARKRLIRYQMANVAAMVPKLNDVLHELCDHIMESVDEEIAAEASDG